MRPFDVFRTQLGDAQSRARKAADRAALRVQAEYAADAAAELWRQSQEAEANGDYRRADLLARMSSRQSQIVDELLRDI